MKKQITNFRFKKSVQFFFLFMSFFSLLKSTEQEHSPNASESLLHSPYLCQSVNVITGDYCEAATDYATPSDTALKIRRCYSNEFGWFFNLPLTQSSLPKDIDSPFTYLYDSKERLISINTNSSKKPSIQIVYPEQPNTGMILQLNGTTLSYEFEKPDSRLGIPSFQIKRLCRNEIELCRYSYSNHPSLRKQLLDRKDECNGNFIINEYYDKKNNQVGDATVIIDDPVRDPIIGRVKLQKAPVGTDSTPVITARYFYHPGYTEVLDALNRKTVYHYQDDRLTTTEFHNEGNLYRTERLYWEKSNKKGIWNLIAKAWQDAQGDTIKCQTFTYDSEGRHSSETLYGSLSGRNIPSPVIDDKGAVLENGTESYSIRRSYSEDATSRYETESHDSGKVILHSYAKDTSLKTAEFTGSETAIFKRCFYEYNERQLVAVYIDNGSSTNIHDMQGVTARYATTFHYGKEGSALPEVTEEKYLDTDSGCYNTLRRTVCSYDQQGNVTSKQIFNCDGTLNLSTNYSYDSFGRISKEMDDSGTGTEKTYDALGNLLTETLIENHSILQQSRHTYDLGGRPIAIECFDSNGNTISQKCQYNIAGEKIAEIDTYGNITSFGYDDLGRLISAKFPSVTVGQNHQESPIHRYGYDVLDNRTHSFDAKGNQTLVRYNAYGKPVEKTYPDQTREIFYYTLEGLLSESIDTKNVKTTYERDVLGRETLIEVRDAASHVRYSLESTYSTFQLVKTVKDGRLATEYTYDKSGRIASKDQKFAEGWQRVEFTYDSASRVQTQTETWSGAHEGLVTKYIYDATGNLLKTTLSDLQGSILKETSAETASPDYTKNNENIVKNELGQAVRQIITTDSQGEITTLTYDALGRIDSLLIKNCSGNIIKHTEFQYDLAGNKTREVSYDPQTSAIRKVIKWTYDSCNRLKTYIEAADSSEARITHYSYNAMGQLEQTIKPDGVTITQYYSALGQLKDYYASDFSFKYHFYYDDQGHLTKVEDLIHHTSTNRKVNTFGQVVYEELENGQKIRNAYDSVGKKTKITLPDNSFISYRYDALNLQSVDRYSNNGKHLYSHKYNEYDAEGRVTHATMIGAAGQLSLAHDGTACRSIKSDLWSQEIPKNGIDAFGNITAVEGIDSHGAWYASYAYNNNGYLEAENSVLDHIYAYDENANRIAADGVTYRNDILDQLYAKELGCYNAFDAIDYAYDLNGNLVEKVTYENRTVFHYDALNRLTNVEMKNSFSIQFIYDAFHRRISKSVKVWNKKASKWIHKETLRYLYDGDREIGAVDSNGNIIELRILGCPLIGGSQHSEISSAVAIELDGHAYAPLHDHRGNVGCLIDSESGSIAECYRYSAFGTHEIYSDEGSLLEVSQIENPWMFSSKRSDSETGLIYFGKRYYDADMARWITKDPLGSFDGDNAYAFLQNNPLSHIDLYGLFSISTQWNKAREWASHLAESLNGFKQKNSYENYVKKDLDHLAESVFGRVFMQFCGYYSHPVESGRSPFGNEINEKVRITLINGILNIKYDIDTLLKIFSDAHGDMPIHYVFRPTEGWTRDVVISTLSKFGYTTPYAKQLALKWKQLIEEMGGVDGGGKIIHYAHSIGATDTYVAKNLLTPEEQMMIHVITLGSPTMIPQNSGFGSATNYVSKRDGVCFLDPIGYLKGCLHGHSKIEFIGSLWGIPLIDHTLYTDTYGGIIKELGLQFLGIYRP